MPVAEDTRPLRVASGPETGGAVRRRAVIWTVGQLAAGPPSQKGPLSGRPVTRCSARDPASALAHAAWGKRRDGDYSRE